MFYMAKGHRTDAAAKLGGLVNEVSFCREKQKEIRGHEWIHFRSQMKFWVTADSGKAPI